MNFFNIKAHLKFTFLLLVFLNTLTFGNANEVDFSIRANTDKISEASHIDIIAEFKLAKDIHIYANKVSEFGQATTINWTLPEGFKLEDMHWQKSVDFTFFGIKSQGYEDKLLVKAKISTPKRLTSNSIKISAKATWLACKADTCTPGQALSELTFNTTGNQSQLSTIIFAIFGAFLGGLILNIMPCVLPVIGIKILSITQSNQVSKYQALKSALLYVLGVLVSFWALALILILVKLLGENLGWGFQLQNPIFTSLMAILFFIIALNFAGLFEIGTSFIGLNFKAQNKHLASFLTGTLAVLVASPCTAPFMGSALGIALANDSAILTTFAIFTSLGMGMASPFLVIALFPKLLAFIPKAGVWSVRFKQVLSIPLFLSVIWLSWVYVNQQGQLYIILLSFMLISLGFAIYGKFTMPNFKSSIRKTASIFCLAMLITSITLVYKGIRNESFEDSFDLEKQMQLIKTDIDEGYIVYVDITAKWCLTCQYNKRVLYSEEIQNLFKEKKVKIITVDWTNNAPNILKYLESFGRNGVPLNLIYTKENFKDPTIMPSILTKESLIDSIDKFCK